MRIGFVAKVSVYILLSTVLKATVCMNGWMFVTTDDDGSLMGIVLNGFAFP